MFERINRLLAISNRLAKEYGREPNVKELATEMGLSPERVVETIKANWQTASLETPVGKERDSYLGDCIKDETMPQPNDITGKELLKEELGRVLASLPAKQQRVIELRFGLGDGRNRTLEEVGKELNVTRERIRQIEARALSKLRHPSRSRKLKEYLE